MANNNLTNAAKKIADALNAIARADKTKEGKMAKLEQEKLLKLIGDKKRLDGIDAKMATAEREYARIVRSGDEESRRLVRLANDKIAAAKANLENAERESSVTKDRLDAQVEATKLKALELENDALALQSRETAANDRTAHLHRMERELVTREKAVAEREVEVKRFDAWRAAAPA